MENLDELNAMLDDAINKLERILELQEKAREKLVDLKTRVDELNVQQTGWQECPICRGSRVIKFGETKILCPNCTMTEHS